MLDNKNQKGLIAMRKKFWLLPFVSAAILICSSCSSSADSQIIPAVSKTDEFTNASKTVRMYSCMQEEVLISLKKAFETKYPNITLEYYFASEPKIITRLITESESGQTGTDVIWLSEAINMLDLKSKGILKQYVSKECNSIPSVYRDPDGYFSGVALVTFGIGYNTDKISRQEVPKTWEEFAANKWYGQTVMADPGSSGSAMFAMETLMQDEKYGHAFFERLYRNQTTIKSNTYSVHSAVARGKFSLGICLKYITQCLSAKGFPIAFQQMDQTCDMTALSCIGLVSGQGIHEENGKLLYDFLLSEDGKEFLESNYFTPVQGTVPKDDSIFAENRYLFMKQSDYLNEFDGIFMLQE